MKLFLLRHGQAGRASSDDPRALTAHGRDEVRRIGEYFKKHKITVHHIWHSPKTRAIQTAQVFRESSGNLDAAQEEKDVLKPDGNVAEGLQALEGFQGPSLLLVTHMPFVVELAHELTGGLNDAEIAFPTAGMVAFERKGDKWKWLWSLEPSALQ